MYMYINAKLQLVCIDVHVCIHVYVFVTVGTLVLSIELDYSMEAVTMENKTAIVTGANTGIGIETARELARRGEKIGSYIYMI